MTEEIRFESVEGRRLACLDVKGPYQEVLPAGFQRLFGWAGPRGIVRGAPMGIYIDSPEDTPMEECRSVVAVPVAPDAQGEGEFRIEELPSRLEAVLLYKGPYDCVGPAWGRVFDAVFKGGYRMSAPPMEVYLNDPMEVPPEELLTEIRVPVERA